MAYHGGLAEHQGHQEHLLRRQVTNQTLSFGGTCTYISIWARKNGVDLLLTCSTKRPMPVRVIPRPPKICTASRAVSCAVCVAYIFSNAIGPARCFAWSLYDCNSFLSTMQK